MTNEALSIETIPGHTRIEGSYPFGASTYYIEQEPDNKCALDYVVSDDDIRVSVRHILSSPHIYKVRHVDGP